VLYKYAAFGERTQSIFESNELYFSSPGDFNDPFDSIVRFVYEGSKQQRKRLLREWSPRHAPDKSRKELLGLEKRILRQNLDIDAQTLQTFHGTFERNRRRIGILCMAEERDNILMWSHYAHNHQGFCLEFRTENPFFARAQKVEYNRLLPRINILEPQWDKIITKGAKGLLTKATDWEYEKEWRIIDLESHPGIQKFPPEALSGVILGHRSEEHRERITHWCRQREHPPTLYEARVKDKEFGLDIVPIS